MTNYQRPALCWGNDFTLNIELERFMAEEIESFDLTKTKSIEVYLFCGSHGTKIPLKWTITGENNNTLSCFVDYRVTHPNQAYGVCVEGDYEDGKHFRWYMQPREGILIINNSSGQNIPDEEQIVDLKGRVGFSIPSQDLSDYYTKEETDDLLDDKQDTLVSGSNIKTINNQSILGTGNINIEIPEQVQSDWNETNSTNPAYIQNKPNLSTYVTDNELQNELSNYVQTEDLSTYVTDGELQTELENYVDNTELTQQLSTKQDTLVSGSNIKSINGQSILGEGNITIEGGTGSSPIILTYGVTNNIPEDLLEQAQNGRTIICQYITVTAATWDIEGYLMGQTIKFEKYYTLGNVPRLIEVILMKNNNNQWQWSNNVSEYYNKSQTNNLINTLENNTNDLVDGVKSNVHTLAESTIKQFDEINKSVDEVVNDIPNKVNEKIDELNNDLSSKDKVTAEALNHINQRVEALEEGGGSMPTNYVESFNGQTGAVTYTAPVTSVNGQTGAVNISIPTNTSDLTNDSGFLTSAPVTSVNGQTGAVNISIPTNTSDLNNDSGFLTSAPVTSVNGQTGTVTIDTGVTSFNGQTGVITYTAPVTSVNGMTGAVTIQTGGTQEQADWAQTDTTAVDYIKNKPSRLKLKITASINNDNNAVYLNDFNVYDISDNLIWRYRSHTLDAGRNLNIVMNYIKNNVTPGVSYHFHIDGAETSSFPNVEFVSGGFKIPYPATYSGIQLKAGSLLRITTSHDMGSLGYVFDDEIVSITIPSNSTAPVTSVNGMTGAITLSIPTNTSDLNNDSGFLTSAPVTSVNGQTGAVNISIPDTTGMVTSTTSGLKIEVVSALPSSPDSNTIYIIQ